jgi:hypothetical protein
MWPGYGYPPWGPITYYQDNAKKPVKKRKVVVDEEVTSEQSSGGEIEDGELQDSEEDNLKKIKDLARELEMDVDRVNYRAKVELAGLILQEPVVDSAEPSASLVEGEDRQGPIAFPFSTSLEKHFKGAWVAANGVPTMAEVLNRNILTPPPSGVQVGKRLKPKEKPKLKWYKIQEKANPGWPLGVLKVDSGFVDKCNYKLNVSEFRSLDEAMELNGNVLMILNQMAFFHRATTEVVKDLESSVGEELSDTVKSLKDFVQVQAQSLEDIMSCSTNLMTSLLLDKRSFVLGKASNLSAQDRGALRFMNPLSLDATLFSGKIEEFWKEKKDISSARMNEAVASYIRKTRFDNKPDNRRQNNERSQGSGGRAPNPQGSGRRKRRNNNQGKANDKGKGFRGQDKEAASAQSKPSDRKF